VIFTSPSVAGLVTWQTAVSWICGLDRWDKKCT